MDCKICRAPGICICEPADVALSRLLRGERLQHGDETPATRWLQLKTDDGECHVIPLGDLRDHDAEISCWCCPTPEPDEPCIVVHHSMDRREFYERGDLRPA
jgi:hypothetical protein